MIYFAPMQTGLIVAAHRLGGAATMLPTISTSPDGVFEIEPTFAGKVAPLLGRGQGRVQIDEYYGLASALLANSYGIGALACESRLPTPHPTWLH